MTTIAIRAPIDGACVEVVLISVVLPDGREARFRVSVRAGRRGALRAEIEGKRLYAGRPVRAEITLDARDYSDPDLGVSRFVRDLPDQTVDLEDQLS